MPYKNWSEMNKKCFEKYAKYFAMMEFISLNYEIYESEMEDQRIGFIVKKQDGMFIELEVKPIIGLSFIQNPKESRTIKITNPDINQMLLWFENDKIPESYMIPAIAWKFPNELINVSSFYSYEKRPEYVLSITKKNMKLLDQYRLDKMLESF